MRSAGAQGITTAASAMARSITEIVAGIRGRDLGQTAPGDWSWRWKMWPTLFPSTNLQPLLAFLIFSVHPHGLPCKMNQSSKRLPFHVLRSSCPRAVMVSQFKTLNGCFEITHKNTDFSHNHSLCWGSSGFSIFS